jgi:hypothetical protein
MDELGVEGAEMHKLVDLLMRRRHSPFFYKLDLGRG